MREVAAMRKATAVLGSALFFVVAPFLAAAVIPWWINRWEFRPAFFDLQLTRAIGVILIVAGVPGVVDSFARFALQGLGTPAPVAPPRLVQHRGEVAQGAQSRSEPEVRDRQR